WAASSSAAWPPAKAIWARCAGPACSSPSGSQRGSRNRGAVEIMIVPNGIKQNGSAALAIAVFLGLAAVQAGPDSKDPVKWKPCADLKGAKPTPLDPKGAKAAVLFFAVADCPIANYYTSEINAIVKDYAPKNVRFFIVHVDPEITPQAAAEHAKEYGLACPILIDARHELVKATGVTVTPEAVMLTPDGKTAYRGRIDDRYVELGKRRINPNRT